MGQGCDGRPLLAGALQKQSLAWRAIHCELGRLPCHRKHARFFHRLSCKNIRPLPRLQPGDAHRGGPRGSCVLSHLPMDARGVGMGGDRRAGFCILPLCFCARLRAHHAELLLAHSFLHPRLLVAHLAPGAGVQRRAFLVRAGGRFCDRHPESLLHLPVPAVAPGSHSLAHLIRRSPRRKLLARLRGGSRRRLRVPVDESRHDLLPGGQRQEPRGRGSELRGSRNLRPQASRPLPAFRESSSRRDEENRDAICGKNRLSHGGQQVLLHTLAPSASLHCSGCSGFPSPGH